MPPRTAPSPGGPLPLVRKPARPAEARAGGPARLPGASGSLRSSSTAVRLVGSDGSLCSIGEPTPDLPRRAEANHAKLRMAREARRERAPLPEVAADRPEEQRFAPDERASPGFDVSAPEHFATADPAVRP